MSITFIKQYRMKTLIKNIACSIGWIFSFFCPTLLSTMFRAFLSYIYTGFIKRHFARWGTGSVMEYKALHLRGLENIEIGERTDIARCAVLTVWDTCNASILKPFIKIGDDCHIGPYSHITAMNGISIGNGFLTGSNVLITDNAHGYFDSMNLVQPPAERALYSKGPVKIGNNVWLGNNVCILAGVVIGDGVVVAANSVVTKSVPEKTMVAGAPAKIVKRLD